MHVTPEFAGLIAQVFPTLMIALLIDGRVRIHHKTVVWVPWFNALMLVVRAAAVVGASTSTFVCLAVAGRASAPSDATDWLVMGSGWALFLAFGFAAGHVFGREDTGLTEQFAARTAARKMKRRRVADHG